MFTDASGWGCGGHWGDEWFQLEWPHEWREKSIAVKEMVPVVIACAVWCQQWGQKWAFIRTDNQSVVDAMHSHSSGNVDIMHLLWCFQCQLWVEHVPGCQNSAADALSRNLPQVFQRCVPTALQQPVQIPTPVLQLLIFVKPDWLSPGWRRMLASICSWA